MAKYRTEVEISADSSPLNAALASSRNTISSWQRDLSASSVSAKALEGATTSLASSLGPAALAGSIAAAAVAAVNYGAAMQDLAGQADVTATQASTLSEAYENAGLGATAWVEMANKLGGAVSKAAGGNADLSESFRKVGLDAKQMALMTRADQITAFTNALDTSKPAHMASALTLLGETAAKQLGAMRDAVSGDLSITNSSFDRAAEQADAFGDKMNSIWTGAKKNVLSFAMDSVESIGRLVNVLGHLDEGNSSIYSLERGASRLNAELLRVTATSEAYQRAKAADAIAAAEAANKNAIYNDADINSLISKSRIMPELVDLAEELARLGESDAQASDRRTATREKELAVMEMTTRAQRDLLSNQETSNLKLIDLKQRLSDLDKEKEASLKRFNSNEKEEVSANKKRLDEQAALQKGLEADALAAQRTLNALLGTELDKRKAIVNAAAGAINAYRESRKTPEEKQKDARKEFDAVRNLTSRGDIDGAAKLLPGLIPKLDLLKEGSNPLSQGFIDSIMNGIFKKVDAQEVANTKDTDAKAAGEKAALVAKSGGLAVAPAAAVVANGQSPQAAATESTNWQSMMLDHVSAIRSAVGSITGGSALKF